MNLKCETCRLYLMINVSGHFSAMLTNGNAKEKVKREKQVSLNPTCILTIFMDIIL